MNSCEVLSKVSVVIPFKNSEAVLRRCLEAIYASNVLPYEVIAVNDHAEDASVCIAESFPCKLLNNIDNYGVSSARNLGAEKASGDIILFVDSDIMLKKDSIEKLLFCYNSFDIDGAVGVLSGDIEFSGFCSQYKNLWMRYTYLRLQGTFPPFYSSVASIKKTVFEKTEGFLEKYRKPDIEDTDFGNHLFECGCVVRLCPEVEVVHVKEYSFLQLVTTNLRRGVGLSRFFGGGSPALLYSNIRDVVQGKRRVVTSVPRFFLYSFFVEFMLWTSSLWSLFRGGNALGLFLLGWFLTDCANFPWLYYLARERGLMFAFKASLFVPVEVFTSIVSGVAGVLIPRSR